MTEQTIMSEQASLLATKTSDPVWQDRMIDFNPRTHLGESFILNSLTSEVFDRSTRLIAEQAQESTAQWLRETLVKPDNQSNDIPLRERWAISLPEASEYWNIDFTSVPAAYDSWRMSAEIYGLVDDTIFMLANRQFLRYKRLSKSECGRLFSTGTCPFQTFTENVTGKAIFVVAMPLRLAALGGLRGFRRGLIATGEALSALQQTNYRTDDGWWDWHTEFYDSSCLQILSVDGIERIPIAIAYETIVPVTPDILNELSDVYTVSSEDN